MHEFVSAILEKNAGKQIKQHGVKGQRWGVRRSRKELESSSPDADKAKSHAARVRKGNTDPLSNKELQELVTRMNLEKQFTSLSVSKPAGNKAVSFTKDLVKTIAKEQVKTIAREATKNQVDSFLTGKGKHSKAGGNRKG